MTNPKFIIIIIYYYLLFIFFSKLSTKYVYIYMSLFAYSSKHTYSHTTSRWEANTQWVLVLPTSRVRCWTASPCRMREIRLPWNYSCFRMVSLMFHLKCSRKKKKKESLESKRRRRGYCKKERKHELTIYVCLYDNINTFYVQMSHCCSAKQILRCQERAPQKTKWSYLPRPRDFRLSCTSKPVGSRDRLLSLKRVYIYRVWKPARASSSLKAHFSLLNLFVYASKSR
jgi:hypothetical protein